MKRILISLAIFATIASSAIAQQYAQYSQYMFNGLVINPAYAGYKEIVNANMLARWQWVGIEGAPTTQTFTIDGPVLNKNGGLGLHIMNDELGAEKTTSVYGSYAYRIKVRDDARLSFGLSGGFNQYSTDGSKLSTADANDEAITSATQTAFAPDFKFGVYYYTDKWYGGASVNDLIGGLNKYKSNTDKSLIGEKAKHFFVTAGYIKELGSSLKIKPSFLIKEDLKGPTNIDFNAFLLFQEKIWLGFTYRTGFKLWKNNLDATQLKLRKGDAISFLAQFYASERIRIGLAYDYTSSSLNPAQHGSYEVSLGYYFVKKKTQRMLTPRYF